MAKTKSDAPDAPDAPDVAPAVRAPVIKCVVPFNAFGCVYNTGDVVDPTQWEKVDAHEAEVALQNRMTNGFVKFARPE